MPKFITNTFCNFCQKPVLEAESQEGQLLYFDLNEVYRVVTVMVGKGWRTLAKQQKQNCLPIHSCRNEGGQATVHDPA